MAHLTTLDELKQHITILASVDESGAPFVTLDALRWGEVDVLVMARDYRPDPGWTCSACQGIGTEVPETPLCSQCGKSAVRPLDVREALLRLAGQQERPVEVVEQSDALMSVGGVGCLLRHQPDLRHEEPVDLAQV